MQLHNTDSHFGAVSMTLHWLMAAIIIGLLGLGLIMVRMPISLEKLQFFGWHKEFGLLVLGLAFVRVAWRLSDMMPPLPAHLPDWQKIAARSVHFAFYVFMFALPITGWGITSAAGLPPSFFGLFVLPDLVAPNDHTRILLTEVHKWLSYALIATICMHVGAALQHHFIYKDNILRRMLP